MDLEKNSEQILKIKKVVCTIHHLEEKELHNAYLKEFIKRDNYVDLYHVISKKTINKLTQLPIKNTNTSPFGLIQKLLLHKKQG